LGFGHFPQRRLEAAKAEFQFALFHLRSEEGSQLAPVGHGDGGRGPIVGSQRSDRRAVASLRAAGSPEVRFLV
jgi:hypothetical protein